MTPLRLTLALLLWAATLATALATEDDSLPLPAENVGGDPQPLKLKPRVVSFNVMVAGKHLSDSCLSVSYFA